MEKMKIGKITILLLMDSILINLAYMTALYYRFMEGIPIDYFNAYISSIISITIIYLVCLFVFKLYQSLWKYAGIDELILSIVGCVVAGIFMIFYGIIIGPRLPHGVNILACIFSIIYVVGFRMSFRIFRRLIILINVFNKKGCINVMIVGAGSAGTMIIHEMKKYPRKYYPVALIDDNPYKIGTRISGVKVIGNRSFIREIVNRKCVDEIIIAIPSLNSSNKREIIEICKNTGCRIKMIPSLFELIEGKVTLNQIREVDVEDLLGREPIKLDDSCIGKYLTGKGVLVTGGGGSIGSELCRQIAKYYPKRLLILDMYENNAYDLQNELKHKRPELNLEIIICSVRDIGRLEEIFSEYRPEVVFHAAAHKHVPLMEANPSEAIKNNIFGTLNVAECADKYRVKKFVMISTDKAVNPTSIMGASKRACEMIVQAKNKHSKTVFVAVRFGNVLGSNGSVIPLFKKQISMGGPVTVTNKYITRYFMTIPEASQLVLQAGAYAEGGEIFVLDMGKPVKIYDLACDLIRLSGLEPHKDIKIEITGLRPGEKLYEELLMTEEGLNKTNHEKIFVGSPTFSDLNVLKRKFDELRSIIETSDKEELFSKMEELVPTYKRVTHYENREELNEKIAVTFEENYSIEHAT